MYSCNDGLRLKTFIETFDDPQYCPIRIARTLIAFRLKELSSLDARCVDHPA